MDRVLRNAKVRQLHTWLEQGVSEYAGLYEAGSVAVGDPWVDGRSDREIVIVVGGQISWELRGRLQEQLGRQGFRDTYLFNLTPKQGFLKTQVHNDIAMKFRGQALFGEDLLPEKETPPREFAAGFVRERLRLTLARLHIRVLNGRCWSVEHLRDDLYSELKLMFLSLADKRYAETGKYPKRRLDVADSYASDELHRLATSLVTIDDTGREQLIDTARLAIGVVARLHDFSV